MRPGLLWRAVSVPRPGHNSLCRFENRLAGSAVAAWEAAKEAEGLEAAG